MLFASSTVQELQIDYTHCLELASSVLIDIPDKYVSYNFKGGKVPANKPQWKLINNETGQFTMSSGGVQIPVEHRCFINFDIPTDMPAPVFLFYRLTNFYQNHRRYVQSFNELQINGKAQTADELKKKDDCKPLVTNSEGKPYYPCGLIANSFFNDTFSTLTLLNAPSVHDGEQIYNMTETGISWVADNNRFKKTTYKASDVVPPPDWMKMFPNGYTDDNLPNISAWEPLQNWMRTAGLPTFNKLALRNDKEDLKQGTYSVEIGYNFPILTYEGTKTLVISTSTTLGGRNPFMGIAYLVVAGVCFLLGVLFLIKHLITPRKLGDHSYLTWNNDGQGATATGVNRGDREEARGR